MKRIYKNFDFTYNKMPLEEFLNWIKETVPENSKDAKIELYGYYEECNAYLQISWEK